MKRRILIIGASSRWLAQAAAKRGLPFWAADYFADWDTQQAGPVIAIDRLASVETLVERFRPEAILIGGGMENHWEALAQIVPRCRVLGFDPREIGRVRNPATWAAALREADVPVPDVILPPDKPLGGQWLVKPIHSGGGRGIMFWSAGHSTPADTFFQRWVPGLDASSVYIAAGGMSRLVGVCRQWIGAAELGAHDFQYAGCSGPIAIPSAIRQQLESIGNVAASRFAARGLFGVDFRLDGDVVWPVEINPRPTASVELYERAGCEAIFDWHWKACHIDPRDTYAAASLLANCQTVDPCATRLFGKGIVYWSGHSSLSVDLATFEILKAGYVAGAMADIPDLGQIIRPGSPLVTVFAGGRDTLDVREKLAEISQRLVAELLQIARKNSTLTGD